MTTPAELEEMDHAFMVSKLVKSGEQMLAELTPESFSLLAETMAEVVSAGARLDRAKKQVIYTTIGKPKENDALYPVYVQFEE